MNQSLAGQSEPVTAGADSQTQKNGQGDSEQRNGPRAQVINLRLN
jgi:hypothetical protein